LRDQPPKCSPQKLSTLSAYICSCSCQYCYHIKLKYCLFFSPTAFCDSKSAENAFAAGARHRTWLGSSRRFSRPLVRWGLERGIPLLQSCAEGVKWSGDSPLHLTPSAPHFGESLRNFSGYGPDSANFVRSSSETLVIRPMCRKPPTQRSATGIVKRILIYLITGITWRWCGSLQQVYSSSQSLKI